MMQKLNVGDTVKCADANDMVDTMHELNKCGIDTEFLYELNGQKGLWLVVTKVEV